MIRLSIVVTTYNSEDDIEEIIQHILRGFSPLTSLSDFEIILVDDGCTDDTFARASKFTERIKIIRKERNEGQGSAFKTALDHCQHEWVYLLFGDLEGMSQLSEERLAHLDGLFSGLGRDHDFIISYPTNVLEVKYLTRRLVTQTMTGFFNFLTRDKVPYYNSPGIYRLRDLRGIELETRRFNILAEVNVKLILQGKRHQLFPVYQTLQTNKSTVMPVMRFEIISELIKSFFYIIRFWLTKGGRG